MTASTSSVSSEIDFRALHARYPRRAFRAFKKWARSTSAGSHGARDITRSIVVILVIGSAMLLVAVFAAIMVLVTASENKPILWGALTVILAFVIIAGITFTDIWRRDVRFGPKWRRWMRMDRFTLANRMIYSPEIREPAYEGSVFSIGTARRAFDVVATTAGRYVEIGNYQFRDESGLSGSLSRCGYVRIEADRRLPHFYLRSRRRGLFAKKLGATFGRGQELSLEGNFGDYFRLYAPGGYERDALYLFTPDLMAALIDHAAHYDVEFVDDYVYFYSHRWFNMRSESTYLDFETLVDSVVNKALKRTGAYSDFRTIGNSVALQGARLQRGITFAAVVGVLILIAQVLHLTHVF